MGLELKALVQIHRAEGDTGSLLEDEVQIIQSVLDLHDKLVKEVMTPITRLYTLKADQILDRKITHEVSVLACLYFFLAERRC